MALLVNLFFLLGHIKLSEEVERDHCVDVDDDGEKHDSEYELFSIVSDGFKNDPQSSHSNGHVQQMGGKEEIVVIAKDREYEIPKLVQKWLQKKIVFDTIWSMNNTILRCL